jgi:hypothetical protein
LKQPKGAAKAAPFFYEQRQVVMRSLNYTLAAWIPMA